MSNKMLLEISKIFYNLKPIPSGCTEGFTTSEAILAGYAANSPNLSTEEKINFLTEAILLNSLDYQSELNKIKLPSALFDF